MERMKEAASNNKVIAAVIVGIVCVLIILAAVCGYVGGKSAGGSTTSGSGSLGSGSQSPDALAGQAKAYYQRWFSKYSTFLSIPQLSQCNNFALPRNYIAYHLNGETIVIDGQGTEQAWAEVPWSETFVDSRGTNFPKPRFDTKFKVRWDDSNMYVLMYVQETDLWGTVTQQDSNLNNDNEVEMLMDVDGSLWYYKQVQVNVLSTWRDIVYKASPFDININFTSAVQSWAAGIQSKVYTTGTVNNPGDRDQCWTVELSITFASLAQYTARTQTQPADNEAWFMQFGRAEFDYQAVNNQYQKTSSHANWWSWQECAINFRIQDRWGLVQFKKSLADTNFYFSKWHIYKALFDVCTGLKKYYGKNSKYTTSLYELEVPVYLFSGECVKVPTITLPSAIQFQVTVISNDPAQSPGHIRQDRYVWFG